MTNQELAILLVKLPRARDVMIVVPDPDGWAMEMPAKELGISEDGDTLYLFGDHGAASYLAEESDSPTARRRRFTVLNGGKADAELQERS